MIPRALYPTEPWPLAQVEKHPCMPLLIADAKDPATKPARKRELSALMALLQHVAKDPAAYAEPRPVSQAFDLIRDMPRDYDFGALLEEIVKLKLFVVQLRGFDSMLVPAELATAKAEPMKAERITLATSATPEFAAQVRAFAASQGKNVSDVVHAALIAYMANNA